eukprot:CAMPEP_0194064742 /NCGR_PEP_ID=MMETSP0009_2-20130614/83790_1 /TAXON_ID=210454 /ORGANISM="Grammatophora oceanica, Strain CCMP 410" /LENGTH=31 /DNA_ID= /DNA_START= /DNA_END= /DNA_ORIENTATION=
MTMQQVEFKRNLSNAAKDVQMMTSKGGRNVA